MTITLANLARAMYMAGEYEKLRAFKKTKKKSWPVLGFNFKEVNLIKGLAPNNLNLHIPFQVEGTVTGRSPSVPETQELPAKEVLDTEGATDKIVVSKGGRGSAKKPVALSKRRLLRLANANLRVLRYRGREMHALMGQTSHPVIAQMASIREQEKFRADPRFPLFQVMQRHRRYTAIFKGPTGRAIFS